MQRLMAMIDKVLDFVIVGVGSGFLILLTTLTFVEVLTRYFFGFATAQISSWCVFFLVWLSFATAGLALKEKRHIAMGTLGERLTAAGHVKTVLCLEIFINLNIVVFAVAFTYLGMANVTSTYSSGYSTLIEYVPLYWVWYLALPVGTVTLLFYSLRNLVNGIIKLRGLIKGGGGQAVEQEHKS